jgi:hypoxanthine-guanine phosphoribosyltransferase
MNDSDLRDEIVRLEAQIDELAARIESCRKFILVGRIAVMGGGAVLITMLVSAIQFDPSVMALAVAAVLGGIVAAGSREVAVCCCSDSVRSSVRWRSSLSSRALSMAMTA